MLKKERNSRGLTLAELSERSNVPVNTLIHWEGGNIMRAHLDAVKRVADALGCTVDELISGEGTALSE